MDEFSLLREHVNELVKVCKEDNEEKEAQFNFLVSALTESCKASKTRTLPPINWYYLITLLIKSKYGHKMESKLIELTLMQINNLNSAYSLLKNYLVDTNYFMHLQVISMFKIINFVVEITVYKLYYYRLKTTSQQIILKNFNLILNRFSLPLIKKFLYKLRLFFQTNNANRDLIVNSVSNILEGCCEFFENKTEETVGNQLDNEIIELIKFIFKEITFDVANLNEVFNLILIKSFLEIYNFKDLF